MDITTYQQLYQYLKTRDVSKEWTKQQITTFKKQATYYLIQNNLLFRRNTKNPSELLKVIKSTELESILHNLHSNILSGHFGVEATYNRARSRYYWPNLYKTIAEYIKLCNTCQCQGAPISYEELYSIQVGQLFNQVEIDIVGSLLITLDGNRYIVIIT